MLCDEISVALKFNLSALLKNCRDTFIEPSRFAHKLLVHIHGRVLLLANTQLPWGMVVDHNQQKLHLHFGQVLLLLLAAQQTRFLRYNKEAAHCFSKTLLHGLKHDCIMISFLQVRVTGPGLITKGTWHKDTSHTCRELQFTIANRSINRILETYLTLSKLSKI